MASPHIAGLLAYLLSLQPAKSSAYAVADITPKKLKSHLIAIGTVGALSDVPSNTENILAWNGGGSSNFTDIVHKGGYKVTREDVVEDVVEDLTEKVTEKVTDFAKKVENLEHKMEADLKDFMNSLKTE